MKPLSPLPPARLSLCTALGLALALSVTLAGPASAGLVFTQEIKGEGEAPSTRT